jgi:HEAT repeat protein
MKMYYRIGITVIVSLLAFTQVTLAQDDRDERDALKIAAIEALMSAPPERALPAVTKVLQGNNSDDVKEAALFILSQIETPEAQALLLDTARNSEGDLREEAIAMIGIGGNPEAMAGLREIYAAGDNDVREAVLEAYLIADDSQSVYELALAADNQDDLEDAIEILGAMGAIEDLRNLLDEVGRSEVLIEAYAIAGDVETLQMIAADSSDPDAQIEALEALGIVGDEQADEILVQVYRDADDEEVRQAALEGMLISGNDTAMLQLYRETDDAALKRELLEMLSIMGSDEVWDLIDEALEGQR